MSVSLQQQSVTHTYTHNWHRSGMQTLTAQTHLGASTMSFVKGDAQMKEAMLIACATTETSP